LIQGAELFRAGKYRGKTYDIEFIDAVIKNHPVLKAEEGLDTPMKVDHSESARDLVGDIIKVYRLGETLLGDILLTEQFAVDKYANGTWKKISAELYHNYVSEQSEKEYGPTLRGAAIVAHPQVKKIKGLAVNGEEFDDEGGGKMDLEKLMEGIRGIFSEFAESLRGAIKSEPQKTPESASVEQLQEQLIQAQTALAAEKDNSRKLRLDAFSERVVTVLDELTAKGYMIPAAREFAEAILLTEVSQDGVVVLGEGDKQEKLSISAAFKKFMEANGKVIEYSEKSRGGDDNLDDTTYARSKLKKHGRKTVED